MTTKNDILARFTKIRSMGTEYNNYIHETAMALVHFIAPAFVTSDGDSVCGASGDVPLALALVEAMPASLRRTMMIEWFARFTPIRVKLGDKGNACGYDAKYKALKTDEEKAEWWSLSSAMDLPFFAIAEQVKEQDAKAYSIDDILKMLQKEADKYAKKIAEGKVEPRDLDLVNTVIAGMENVQSLAIVAKAKRNVAKDQDQTLLAQAEQAQAGGQALAAA